MQISLGYPSEEDEAAMLEDRRLGDPLDSICPQIETTNMLDVQEVIKNIQIEKSIAAYMMSIVRSTRVDERVKLGASPRALLTLARCVQAYAWFHMRDYVIPDDVKILTVPVLAHRLVLDLKAKHSGISAADIVNDILINTPVPR